MDGCECEYEKIIPSYLRGSFHIALSRRLYLKKKEIKLYRCVIIRHWSNDCSIYTSQLTWEFSWDWNARNIRKKEKKILIVNIIQCTIEISHWSRVHKTKFFSDTINKTSQCVVFFRYISVRRTKLNQIKNSCTISSLLFRI